MSLRSILGGSGRVKKRTSSTLSSRPTANRSPSSSSPSPSPSSSWTSSLPRRKPGVAAAKKKAGKDEDFFGDGKLDDFGLVAALATDLGLRDTPQAIAHIRAHMFAPVPETAAGMTSTRIAETLNYRRNLPPLVSVAHVQALLASPSAVERETAELARRGFLRRISVPRRGAVGDFVVLASDYEASLRETAAGLSDGAREGLLRFLVAYPDAQVLSGDALAPPEIRELVHAGFLTAQHTGGVVSHGAISGTLRAYARPEDKITLTSLETVSRQAAGTVGTVGGEGALHNVGGSGGGGGSLSGLAPTSAPSTEYRLAAPGAGSYLKLVSAALDHLVSLLGKSKFREAPESVLRERWDGGIVKTDEASARRARGEFAGVLPGQTRKWRQFYGLSFDWVLREAVGAGLVEVFETRSVGRGVRAIG